jgi:hypothetical protein
VVISGGVDSNENPLNEIIFFNVDTYEIKKLQLKSGYIFPRYLFILLEFKDLEYIDVKIL